MSAEPVTRTQMDAEWIGHLTDENETLRAKIEILRKALTWISDPKREDEPMVIHEIQIRAQAALIGTIP